MFLRINTWNKIVRRCAGSSCKPIIQNFSIARGHLHRNMATNPPGCDTDIVWMDLEMTGLDVSKDKVLEVACLISDKDLNIKTEGLHLAINYPKEVFENMNEWCKKHHNESGLVERCLKSDVTREKAQTILLKYLQEHVPERKCPLAGNSVYMDRLFLRLNFADVDEYLHYRIIDVSTIKELTRRWKPEVFKNKMAPQKRFTHRSLEDIEDSIEELRFYRKMFFNQ